ncbi:MAG: arylesterase [Methylotenera sp.]
MKKIIFLLLIVVAALAMAWSGNDDVEKHAAIPQGATVLVLGDSLSYGTGANAGEDYPALLAKRTGWNIINEGIPGDTSEGGLQRLPALLEAHQPKLLIVELGGNDLLRQAPQAEIVHNLKTILSMAKTQGASTILVAMPEISPLKAAVGNLSDHPLYENIAKETATPLIADVFSDVLSDRDLKSDQIHANALGYRVISDKLYVKLQELGYVN